MSCHLLKALTTDGETFSVIMTIRRKNLGFLCPTNDGFVQLVELYFTQEVTMVLDDEDKRR